MKADGVGPKPSFGVGCVPLGDGFLKDWVKNVGAVATLLQPFIEIAKQFLAVVGVGQKAMDSFDRSMNHSLEHTRRVCGCRGQEKM